MALFDAALLFSGAISAVGALTGQAANGAGNVLGANVADVGSLSLGGNQAHNLGRGQAMRVAFRVLTAPTVGTSVRFQLIQADDAALTTNVQVIGQSDDIPIASLPAGTQIVVVVGTAYPPKRYVSVRYVNTGAIATFSVLAAIANDIQDPHTPFTSGFSVA